MLVTYLIGTAGSGKSTMTESLRQVMDGHGLDVATINLDPGVKQLPYTPDVDARDYVDYDDVAAKYGLGPNGAQIAASDMVASYAKEIKDEIDDMDPQNVLVDTPGQLELFVFRKVGKIFSDVLGGEKKAILYLFDSNLIHDPFSFVSVFLLGLSVQFRFMTPQLNVLNKVDLLEASEVERVLDWAADPNSLEDAISANQVGMEYLLANQLQDLLSNFPEHATLLPFSKENPATHSLLWGELERLAGSEDELL